MVLLCLGINNICDTSFDAIDLKVLIQNKLCTKCIQHYLGGSFPESMSFVLTTYHKFQGAKEAFTQGDRTFPKKGEKVKPY